MLKRSLVLLLALVVISLVGCGGGGNGDDNPVGPGEDSGSEEETVEETWSGTYSGDFSGNVTLVVLITVSNVSNAPVKASGNDDEINVPVKASGNDDKIGEWFADGEGTITNNTVEVTFSPGGVFASAKGTLSENENKISGTWIGSAYGYSGSGNFSVTKQ